MMGYETQPDDQPNAAVERFMRDYYRCAMQISTLSEMLTNHYYETIIEPQLPDEERPKKHPINARFNRVGEQIAISHHRSEEHTSELQSRFDLVCRLLLEKKKESCCSQISTFY